VTASRDAERDAIKAAMDRLLNGAPAASTGALSVLQLAAEAGVKRWVLTHKHPDLKAEFERRRTASNGIPSAFQNIQAHVTDLEDTCRRLRADKTELTERVQVYAQVIHELTAELSRLREERASPRNVIRLPAVSSAPLPGVTVGQVETLEHVGTVLARNQRLASRCRSPPGRKRVLD